MEVGGQPAFAHATACQGGQRSDLRCLLLISYCSNFSGPRSGRKYIVGGVAIRMRASGV
jgi:hypothetical protein